MELSWAGASVEGELGVLGSLETGEAGGLGHMRIGSSISVDGVCLTATEVTESFVAVDVVPETLERTTLSDLAEGDRVNLEFAMSAGDPLDGHIVQGHVDGVGHVVSVDSADAAVVMSFEAPDELSRFIVEKGSIAVSGVSLTIASADGARFTVALIPTTLEVSNLGLRKPGDAVNLEVDIIAKYVDKMMRAGT